MLSRKLDGPLRVEVPSPVQDRPSWRRVGIIGVVGFVVGVAWPRLAGVRLGPSLPPESAPSAFAVGSVASVPLLPPAAPVASTFGSTVASAAANRPPDAPTSPPPSPAPSAIGAAPSDAAGPPAVIVDHGQVVSCKTAEGDSLKGSQCGKVSGLDSIVRPRLRKVADCPDAAGASGKVQFALHLELTRGLLTVELVRDHAPAFADALLACARSELNGAPITAVTHDQPRYVVTYNVTLGPPARAVATATANGVADAGEDSAQVVWEVALVRDAPKTGAVLARLPRGDTVHLGPVKDGWYPVRYGEGFASGGWVYRGAVGR